MLNSAYDKNPPKDVCQRDNKLMYNTCEIAGVKLPKDKVCDHFRSAGMNRAKMYGVTINNVSRMSKHDTNDKLNSSYMTQAPENIMHGNAGHFVCPDYEPCFLPMSLKPVPEWLKCSFFTRHQKTESNARPMMDIKLHFL